MTKKILLLVSAVTLILLSCVAVAFLTNYLINRTEAPAKSPAALPTAPPIVKASEDGAVLQTGELKPQLQSPVLIKEPKNEVPAQANANANPDENIVTPVDMTNTGTDQVQKSPFEEKNIPPAVSQPQAAPIFLPTQPMSANSAATQLPPFTPVTNTTGPVVSPTSGNPNPQASPADITSFVPQTSTTGPAPEKTESTQPLPQFTPVQNQTGPVKTDNQ